MDLLNELNAWMNEYAVLIQIFMAIVFYRDNTENTYKAAAIAIIVCLLFVVFIDEIAPFLKMIGFGIMGAVIASFVYRARGHKLNLSVWAGFGASVGVVIVLSFDRGIVAAISALLCCVYCVVLAVKFLGERKIYYGFYLGILIGSLSQTIALSFLIANICGIGIGLIKNDIVEITLETLSYSICCFLLICILF